MSKVWWLVFIWAGLAVFFDSEKYNKGRCKVMDASCSCYTTLSLPFYTDPDSKRELNFCNGYLSLLYFWKYRFRNTKLPTLAEKNPKQIDLINTAEPMSIPINDLPYFQPNGNVQWSWFLKIHKDAKDFISRFDRE